MTTNPNIPVNQTNNLVTLTILEILASSSVELAAEMFFTELRSIPKLVNEVTKLIVLVRSPAIPIPDGPKSIAINFDFTILTKIVTTCTPPKSDVD